MSNSTKTKQKISMYDSHNSSTEAKDQKQENFSSLSSSSSSNEIMQDLTKNNQLENSIKSLEISSKNIELTDKEKSKQTPTTIQQKRSRFIKRLSTHTGSFFSKSYPNEESSDVNSTKTATESNHEDNKETNEKSSRRHKFFAFANVHRITNKLTIPKKSFDTSSVDTNNNSNNSNNSSISGYSIASFEIDIEKLTRELAMPTLDQPLTSFKKINSLEDQQK
jgi:hypothetical protein